MPQRVLVLAVLAVVAAAAAAYVLKPARGAPEGAPRQEDMAAGVGAPVMRHIKRGYVPGRSGDVFLVPKPYSYLVGEWDLTSLGTSNPWMTTTHPNPWAYISRIPLIFYGPGYVPNGVRPDQPVDAADLVPTYARMMRMDGVQADGQVLEEIGRGKRPPKAIVTVIVDGGGWNALHEHTGSWPALDRLRKAGTSYENATTGSAPSITGAIHATFGTGDYPVTHGLPGNQLRAPEGSVEDAWLENADPRFLEVPTLSDVWDRDRGNKAIVAAVAFEGWHLGMIGHGAQTQGGDKDIAVLWNDDEAAWWINRDYYTLPTYLEPTDLNALESYERALDDRDGIDDGAWFGHSLDYLRQPTVRPGSPAFVRFTGDAVHAVVAKEGIGQDGITDLVWVEYKAPDFAGHLWNMVNAEEGDVLREVDRQIARLKRQLDRKVGKGSYVLAISADHGQQPLPESFGGWRINSEELELDIEARFGSVVQKVTTVDVYFNRERLRDEGFSFADVARYLGTYTIGDNIPEDAPGADRVPVARLDERLFAGAFSRGYIESLTSETIASFGAGDYDEGALDQTTARGTG